jgi:hypothetical protein
MKQKSIKTKKKLLDIVYELKDGRSEIITYGGNFNDEYLIKNISEKVAKLKLGDKLITLLEKTPAGQALLNEIAENIENELTEYNAAMLQYEENLTAYETALDEFINPVFLPVEDEAEMDEIIAAAEAEAEAELSVEEAAEAEEELITSGEDVIEDEETISGEEITIDEEVLVEEEVSSEDEITSESAQPDSATPAS